MGLIEIITYGKGFGGPNDLAHSVYNSQGLKDVDLPIPRIYISYQHIHKKETAIFLMYRAMHLISIQDTHSTHTHTYVGLFPTLFIVLLLFNTPIVLFI